MARLRRTDLSGPCLTRRRHGRGFTYYNGAGARITDPATLARIRALVIPPAWRDVWICPYPDGHIQAVGTDAAGRRQYRYHDDWRAERDREKHEHALDFAQRLPHLREMVCARMAGRGLTRERVLATAVRLLDIGFFRLGSEEYAEENETFGIATLLREHVTCSRDAVTFEYPAKGSKQREQAVVEPDVRRVLLALKRRPGGGAELLAYRNAVGWHDVRSEDINGYLREIIGNGFTAKDFRTWHATVLAAVALAVSTRVPLGTAGRKRAVVRAVKEVAEYLGNTPAVARASYIDPRVIELYEEGVTVAPALGLLGEEAEYGELATQGPVEEAVLKLLRGTAA
ncbi:MAG: DNA topoisomerase IB [Actinobacteria bacterium]|nr:DNA topoisomerase IB [Actinomycetota bacterium]